MSRSCARCSVAAEAIESGHSACLVEGGSVPGVGSAWKVRDQKVRSLSLFLEFSSAG